MLQKKISAASLALCLANTASYSISAHASNPSTIGKATSLKGLVNVIHGLSKTGGAPKPIALQENGSLYVGDTIVTAAGASVILNFQDDTQMALGPESRFKIDEFHSDKQKPSIFSMVMGALRAKVSKSVNGDVKAVIKTRSSTMGVRGTDFQVIYNNTNQMTSLVTYEGAVAMVKSEGNGLSPSIPVTELVDKLVDTSQAVTVTQGQFAGVNPAAEMPTVPVKISPSQLELLKSQSMVGSVKTNSIQSETTPSNVASNSVRTISPIPPGVDPKVVSHSVRDLQDSIAASGVASNQSPDNAQNQQTRTQTALTAPPEGFFNANTGQVAPPAGGFVDLRTGLYVPPPPGSLYDAVAQVYIPPPSFGTVNAATGEYVPPAGFVLDARQGFVPVNESNRASDTANNQGTPAQRVAGPNGTVPNVATTVGNRSGIVFPGANQQQFGSMNVAPAQVNDGRQAQVAMQPPSESLNMRMPGGFVPNFDGMQPQYPVYNPIICPPYCDPQFQPGALPPPPPGLPPRTAVTFNIQ